MWSGPRTLSTTLMRSWGSRSDTVVVDEPLYAFYLRHTPVGHPGREAILASQPDDWRAVLDELVDGPVAPTVAIQYQKHMTHHLRPEIDRRRLQPLRHAFLIRDPRASIASYARVRAEPTLADLGLAEQVELHRRFGGPVVDADDILRAPGAVLRALCASLDVAFDPAMLSWPSGRRATDGVWAPHWYASVEASTGFGPPPRTPAAPPPGHLSPLVAQSLPLYEELWRQRIVAG
jgi:hypothetical protein